MTTTVCRVFLHIPFEKARYDEYDCGIFKPSQWTLSVSRRVRTMVVVAAKLAIHVTSVSRDRTWAVSKSLLIAAVRVIDTNDRNRRLYVQFPYDLDKIHQINFLTTKIRIRRPRLPEEDR